MNPPSDDEIQQFFDTIKPEDFAAAPGSTARSQDEELYPRHGAEEFERFTLDCLSTLIEKPSETIAVLHDGATARTFSPTDCEDLTRFLQRVRKEAKDFRAQWFFVGAPGEAAIGDVFNPNDMKSVFRARLLGQMIATTNWYSESREASSTEVWFGLVRGEGESQQIVRSTYSEGANPAFKRVLRFK